MNLNEWLAFIMCVWISAEVVCLHCYSTIWFLQVKLLLSYAPFVYTMQPVFIVTSHKATYIWWMCVCMLWSGSQIINVIIMLFCCNLPPALLEERPGSLICYCSNTGVEQVPNWESAQKVDPGEENSHATSAWTWTCGVFFFYHEFGTLPLSVFTVSIFN